MALTSVEHVKRVAGFDVFEDAHRLFRFDTGAELDEFIEDVIPVSTAWLRHMAPTEYASADPDIQALFKWAEAYLTLSHLAERLKTLKVTGTHFPFLQEESDRISAVIETDYEGKVDKLVGHFFTIDSPEQPVVLPTFGIGGLIDPQTVQTREQELADILDEARGFPVAEISTV